MDVDRILREIERTASRVLPNLVAATAVNFVKERFRAQNWVDSTTKPWPRRKSKTWGRKTPRNKGRAVLVDTGRLRRSIRKIKADAESVIIGTDVEYAQVHNEGFRGKITQTVNQHTRNRYGREKRGRGVYSVKTKKELTKSVTVVKGVSKVGTYTRTIRQNIPKRQFIGQSAVLNRQIERVVQAAFTKALK